MASAPYIYLSGGRAEEAPEGAGALGGQDRPGEGRLHLPVLACGS